MGNKRKKKRHIGIKCEVCGNWKPEKHFTKGGAVFHICKKCELVVEQSHPDEIMEFEKDYGIFNEYLEYGPQYDTVNDEPIIGGTEILCRTSFNKLTKEARTTLRNYMSQYVLVEKARAFDPFGHAGFDPSGKIRMTP